ncbi:MAG: outer membrane beta-barrel protein [Ferruginibacter sp.]|nr:outer membrane beta-barrel protein [Ferruginibacter sp.]NOU38865.1 outer membrane beta-barrel protein [Ferruginibacter sp.]
MKQTIFLLTFAFIFSFVSVAQLDKKTWLVGGSGAASISNSNLNGELFKSTKLSISPNIGYFLFDKFNVGIKTSFEYLKNENLSPIISYTAKYFSFNIGPFVRYYFLPKEKRTNLFVETSYQIKTRNSISAGNSSKENASTFSINAGPAIYFNSSVGIEFTVGYSSTKYKLMTGSYNTLLVGIGLQIHLIKDEK